MTDGRSRDARAAVPAGVGPATAGALAADPRIADARTSGAGAAGSGAPETATVTPLDQVLWTVLALGGSHECALSSADLPGGRPDQ